VSNIFEQNYLRASLLEPLLYLQSKLCCQILTFLAYDSNLGHEALSPFAHHRVLFTPDKLEVGQMVFSAEIFPNFLRQPIDSFHLIL
jgi:hypothetical protein